MLMIYTVTETVVRSRDDRVEELIERMSQGEISAMGDLYELIERDVYAYALSKTVNKADAEDITHDTFVQIWKNAAQYKPRGKPLAWIFTIEINLVRRQFNLSRRCIPLDQCIETKQEDDFTEGIINNEFLRQVLLLLNEDEREIISLHIVSGLKHREIAKLLGMPISTVLSKYNRAMKKLKANFNKGEADRE